MVTCFDIFVFVCWIYCCWRALSWAELSLIILYFILMAESFHNRMSKIFSYISEDEDKKIVLFEKRLHSYLYKILVNTVKGTLMMWAAWREKSSQGRKKHPKSSLRRNLFKTGWASLSHSGKSSRWGEKRTGSCFCVSSSNSHSVLTALGLWRGWKKLCAAMKGLRRKVWNWKEVSE